jgi:hypothetical protein
MMREDGGQLRLEEEMTDIACWVPPLSASHLVLMVYYGIRVYLATAD